MSGCGAVFILLGERPEDDRLERCTRWPCHEHMSQLAWICDDSRRLAAYAELERRYDSGDRAGPGGEQAVLL